MAVPTQEEKAVLEKFREAIKGADLQLSERQQTDISLVSWLRAAGLDVPKALDMLTKNLAWRKEVDIETLLTWKPPASYPEIFPWEICGKCKDGSPVAVVPFGKWDVRTAVEAGEKVQWIRYMSQLLALIEEEVHKNNAERDPKLPPISQCVIVCDFEGFGLRQLTSVANVQTFMEATTTLMANYPELVKALIYVNIPRVFPIFFSMVKPLLGGIVSRIQMFTGANQNKCNEALLKLASPDQLPTYLGGTKANSCKFFSHGYVPPVEPEIEGTESITTDIPAGHDYILEYEITKEQTLLEWTFSTEAHNIGFCITHNTKYEVLPYQKYDAHLEKQKGSYVCEKPGIYALTFDNKYSQFRGKTLHFTMCVTEPEDTQL